MTHRTASPIATLWIALENDEPRYERARTVEDRLMARYGAGYDNPSLNRTTALTDRIGARLTAAVGTIVQTRATTLGELALKAAVALRLEDDAPVSQSLARDVLATAQQGFSARDRSGALLTTDQLAGIKLR